MHQERRHTDACFGRDDQAGPVPLVGIDHWVASESLHAVEDPRVKSKGFLDHGSEVGTLLELGDSRDAVAVRDHGSQFGLELSVHGGILQEVEHDRGHCYRCISKSYQIGPYQVGEMGDGLTGRVLACDADSMYLMDKSQLLLFRLRELAVEKEMEDSAVFAIFCGWFFFHFLEFQHPFLHNQSATTISAPTGRKEREKKPTSCTDTWVLNLGITRPCNQNGK